jgi:DNA mismatch repair protein MutS2
VKAKRQDVMKAARDEAAQLLRESNAKIENTIRKIKEAQAEKEATRTIRAELTAFRDSLAEAEAKEEALPPVLKGMKRHKQPGKKPAPAAPAEAKQPVEEPFKAGDRVRLKGQLTPGEIISTNGRECVVAFGMIKSTVQADRLERVSKSQLKKEQQQSNLLGGTRSPVVSDEIRERRLHFKQEIDVRGMRGEEALMAVTYYMDDAILLGVSQVRILHGTGTGALRQLIRQYLSTLPGVSSYHDEHVQFGGAGITVVELE